MSITKSSVESVMEVAREAVGGSVVKSDVVLVSTSAQSSANAREERAYAGQSAVGNAAKVAVKRGEEVNGGVLYQGPKTRSIMLIDHIWSKLDQSSEAKLLSSWYKYRENKEYKRGGFSEEDFENLLEDNGYNNPKRYVLEGETLAQVGKFKDRSFLTGNCSGQMLPSAYWVNKFGSGLINCGSTNESKGGLRCTKAQERQYHYRRPRYVDKPIEPEYVGEYHSDYAARSKRGGKRAFKAPTERQLANWDKNRKRPKAVVAGEVVVPEPTSTGKPKVVSQPRGNKRDQQVRDQLTTETPEVKSANQEIEMPILHASEFDVVRKLYASLADGRDFGQPEPKRIPSFDSIEQVKDFCEQQHLPNFLNDNIPAITGLLIGGGMHDHETHMLFSGIKYISEFVSYYAVTCSKCCQNYVQAVKRGDVEETTVPGVGFITAKTTRCFKVCYVEALENTPCFQVLALGRVNAEYAQRRRYTGMISAKTAKVAFERKSPSEILENSSVKNLTMEQVRAAITTSCSADWLDNVPEKVLVYYHPALVTDHNVHCALVGCCDKADDYVAAHSRTCLKCETVLRTLVDNCRAYVSRNSSLISSVDYGKLWHYPKGVVPHFHDSVLFPFGKRTTSFGNLDTIVSALLKADKNGRTEDRVIVVKDLNISMKPQTQEARIKETNRRQHVSRGTDCELDLHALEYVIAKGYNKPPYTVHFEYKGKDFNSYQFVLVTPHYIEARDVRHLRVVRQRKPYSTSSVEHYVSSQRQAKDDTDGSTVVKQPEAMPVTREFINVVDPHSDPIPREAVASNVVDDELAGIEWGTPESNPSDITGKIVYAEPEVDIDIFISVMEREAKQAVDKSPAIPVPVVEYPITPVSDLPVPKITVPKLDMVPGTDVDVLDQMKLVSYVDALNVMAAASPLDVKRRAIDDAEVRDACVVAKIRIDQAIVEIQRHIDNFVPHLYVEPLPVTELVNSYRDTLNGVGKTDMRFINMPELMDQITKYLSLKVPLSNEPLVPAPLADVLRNEDAEIVSYAGSTYYIAKSVVKFLGTVTLSEFDRYRYHGIDQLDERGKEIYAVIREVYSNPATFWYTSEKGTTIGAFVDINKYFNGDVGVPGAYEAFYQNTLRKFMIPDIEDGMCHDKLRRKVSPASKIVGATWVKERDIQRQKYVGLVSELVGPSVFYKKWDTLPRTDGLVVDFLKHIGYRGIFAEENAPEQKYVSVSVSLACYMPQDEKYTVVSSRYTGVVRYVYKRDALIADVEMEDEKLGPMVGLAKRERVSWDRVGHFVKSESYKGYENVNIWDQSPAVIFANSHFRPVNIQASQKPEELCKPHVILVQKKYYDMIAQTEKYAEGRVFEHSYVTVRPSDILTFKIGKNDKGLRAAVTKVTVYPTIEAAVYECGSYLLPGMLFHEAVNTYRALPNYPRRVAANGFVVIHFKVLDHGVMKKDVPDMIKDVPQMVGPFSQPEFRTTVPPSQVLEMTRDIKYYQYVKSANVARQVLESVHVSHKRLTGEDLPSYGVYCIKPSAIATVDDSVKRGWVKLPKSYTTNDGVFYVREETLNRKHYFECSNAEKEYPAQVHYPVHDNIAMVYSVQLYGPLNKDDDSAEKTLRAVPIEQAWEKQQYEREQRLAEERIAAEKEKERKLREEAAVKRLAEARERQLAEEKEQAEKKRREQQQEAFKRNAVQPIGTIDRLRPVMAAIPHRDGKQVEEQTPAERCNAAMGALTKQSELAVVNAVTKDVTKVETAKVRPVKSTDFTQLPFEEQEYVACSTFYRHHRPGYLGQHRDYVCTKIYNAPRILKLWVEEGKPSIVLSEPVYKIEPGAYLHKTKVPTSGLMEFVLTNSDTNQRALPFQDKQVQINNFTATKVMDKMKQVVGPKVMMVGGAIKVMAEKQCQTYDRSVAERLMLIGAHPVPTRIEVSIHKSFNENLCENLMRFSQNYISAVLDEKTVTITLNKLIVKLSVDLPEFADCTEYKITNPAFHKDVDFRYLSLCYQYISGPQFRVVREILGNVITKYNPSIRANVVFTLLTNLMVLLPIEDAEVIMRSVGIPTAKDTEEYQHVVAARRLPPTRIDLVRSLASCFIGASAFYVAAERESIQEYVKAANYWQEFREDEKIFRVLGRGFIEAYYAGYKAGKRYGYEIYESQELAHFFVYKQCAVKGLVRDIYEDQPMFEHYRKMDSERHIWAYSMLPYLVYQKVGHFSQIYLVCERPAKSLTAQARRDTLGKFVSLVQEEHAYAVESVQLATIEGPTSSEDEDAVLASTQEHAFRTIVNTDLVDVGGPKFGRRYLTDESATQVYRGLPDPLGCVVVSKGVDMPELTFPQQFNPGNAVSDCVCVTGTPFSLRRNMAKLALIRAAGIIIREKPVFYVGSSDFLVNACIRWLTVNQAKLRSMVESVPKEAKSEKTHKHKILGSAKTFRPAKTIRPDICSPYIQAQQTLADLNDLYPLTAITPGAEENTVSRRLAYVDNNVDPPTAVFNYFAVQSKSVQRTYHSARDVETAARVAVESSGFIYKHYAACQPDIVVDTPGANIVDLDEFAYHLMYKTVKPVHIDCEIPQMPCFVVDGNVVFKHDFYHALFARYGHILKLSVEFTGYAVDLGLLPAAKVLSLEQFEADVKMEYARTGDRVNVDNILDKYVLFKTQRNAITDRAHFKTVALRKFGLKLSSMIAGAGFVAVTSLLPVTEAAPTASAIQSSLDILEPVVYNLLYTPVFWMMLMLMVAGLTITHLSRRTGFKNMAYFPIMLLVLVANVRGEFSIHDFTSEKSWADVVRLGMTNCLVTKEGHGPHLLYVVKGLQNDISCLYRGVDCAVSLERWGKFTENGLYGDGNQNRNLTDWCKDKRQVKIFEHKEPVNGTTWVEPKAVDTILPKPTTFVYTSPEGTFTSEAVRVAEGSYEQLQLVFEVQHLNKGKVKRKAQTPSNIMKVDNEKVYSQCRKVGSLQGATRGHIFGLSYSKLDDEFNCHIESATMNALKADTFEKAVMTEENIKMVTYRAQALRSETGVTYATEFTHTYETDTYTCMYYFYQADMVEQAHYHYNCDVNKLTIYNVFHMLYDYVECIFYPWEYLSTWLHMMIPNKYLEYVPAAGVYFGRATAYLANMLYDTMSYIKGFLSGASVSMGVVSPATAARTSAVELRTKIPNQPEALYITFEVAVRHYLGGDSVYMVVAVEDEACAGLFMESLLALMKPYTSKPEIIEDNALMPVGKTGYYKPLLTYKQVTDLITNINNTQTFRKFNVLFVRVAPCIAAGEYCRRSYQQHIELVQNMIGFNTQQGVFVMRPECFSRRKMVDTVHETDTALLEDYNEKVRESDVNKQAPEPAPMHNLLPSTMKMFDKVRRQVAEKMPPRKPVALFDLLEEVMSAIRNFFYAQQNRSRGTTEEPVDYPRFNFEFNYTDEILASGKVENETEQQYAWKFPWYYFGFNFSDQLRGEEKVAGEHSGESWPRFNFGYNFGYHFGFNFSDTIMGIKKNGTGYTVPFLGYIKAVCFALFKGMYMALTAMDWDMEAPVYILALTHFRIVFLTVLVIASKFCNNRVMLVTTACLGVSWGMSSMSVLTMGIPEIMVAVGAFSTKNPLVIATYICADFLIPDVIIRSWVYILLRLDVQVCYLCTVQLNLVVRLIRKIIGLKITLSTRGTSGHVVGMKKQRGHRVCATEYVKPGTVFQWGDHKWLKGVVLYHGKRGMYVLSVPPFILPGHSGEDVHFGDQSYITACYDDIFGQSLGAWFPIYRMGSDDALSNDATTVVALHDEKFDSRYVAMTRFSAKRTHFL